MEEYLKIKENVKWKKQRKNTVVCFQFCVKKSRGIIFFNEFRRQQIIVNIRNPAFAVLISTTSFSCLLRSRNSSTEKENKTDFNQIIEIKTLS